MRTTSTLLAACSALLLSCGVNEFDTTLKAQTTVAGAPGLLKLLNSLGPLQGFTNIDFNNNQDFKNQGVTKDDVESVKVKSFQLTITKGDPDFSFLKSLKFLAKSEGLATVTVAEKAAIPAGTKTLELDVPDTELKDYVTAPQMSFVTEGEGHQPDTDTTIEATVILHVEVSAGILKRL